jgi:hypothetical protein
LNQQENKKMEIENTSLTIVGEPDEEVRVLYRDRGDHPPPPIWEGKLDADGRATVDVPQGYLYVFGNHSHRGCILRLHEDKPSELTVELGDKVDENPAAEESE